MFRVPSAALANSVGRHILIYTSDQGFFLGDHGLFDKRFMYEESLRMPFLIRWPAVIKPGSRSDAMALNVDFAETFLEAAGLPVPNPMQGRSAHDDAQADLLLEDQLANEQLPNGVDGPVAKLRGK